ncbi:MAG: hypothetical protein AB8G05_01705 [Oligoflexales bacterium]
MMFRLSIFTLVLYGCGFGNLDAGQPKSKEFTVSSQEENLTRSKQLDSTEVGNGRTESILSEEQSRSDFDKLSSNNPIESTEIGNGNKPDLENSVDTPEEGSNSGKDSAIVTAAFLTSCVLSSSKVDCNISHGEKYDFQNLIVYDLNKNKVPAESVNYNLENDQLEISVEGDSLIGSLEVEQTPVDLSMNVADQGMRDILIGTYNSLLWGDLEIRFSGNGVLIVYIIGEKTIGFAQGSFNEDNGIVTGKWCERSVKKDGKIDNKKLSGSGQLEFHFEYGENQQVQAEGQWNSGEGTNWHNDWNLNKIGDRSNYEEYFDQFAEYSCD